MAHTGVLEALAQHGFQVKEMVGTSVGALIISFYAAVGLDIAEMRELGLNLTSRHLLAWAWIRRLPPVLQRRFERRAGIIPASLRRLAEADGRALHHGVERIGLVCYELNTRSEILFHNLMEEFPLEDATRGAAAIPGLFPSRQCVVEGQTMRLSDGGVVNHLPVDRLFETPFAPEQILVVDIANRVTQREESLRKVEALRKRHPRVPIAVLSPDTLDKGTVIFRSKDLQALIDTGRAAAEEAIQKWLS